MAGPSAPSSVTEALRATLAPVLGPVEVEDLQRLSGGASRETWSFRAGGRDLILRRDPPGRPSAPDGMRREADVMRACQRAGLPVAEVVVDDDGSTLGTAGLVMARVEGESLPRKILSEDRLRAARESLVGQVGAFTAGLHAIDPGIVPDLPAGDVLTDMWAVYEVVEFPSPTFERAQDWLVANRPEASDPVIVHGDLRLGNLLVDEAGLTAVIDWELVHRGDPLEDLAWVCVKSWRFGHAPEVAGLGSIEDLVGAYEGAGGQRVDRDALHWWLVQKTLQWGVICIGQAWAHLSGVVRSHELAAVGRRVAEQEWDLIELLAPAAWADARSAPVPPDLPDHAGVYGRPTARELLTAVRAFLTDDVMPATAGHLSFQTRVAANILGIVERELSHPPPETAGRDWESLARSVRAKLAVANPKRL